MRGRARSILAMTALAVLAAPAAADPIAITNHSFEIPDVSTAAQTWTDVNENWGDDAGDSNDQFTEFIDGFAAEGIQHAGVNGADTDDNGVIDPIMQDVGVNYMANTRYTLTVGVGNRNDDFTPDANETLIQLADATTGNALAERVIDASLIPDMSFQDYTLQYIAGATGGPIGNGIRIQLGVTGPDVGRGHFDNVRLDSEPFIFGDLDMDMDIDADDFTILSNNLAGHLDGPVTYDQGDLNFDGAIGLDDFGLFKDAFAAAGALGQGQAIPEPSSIALVVCVLGALSLADLRKRNK